MECPLLISLWNRPWCNAKADFLLLGIQNLIIVGIDMRLCLATAAEQKSCSGNGKQ